MTRENRLHTHPRVAALIASCLACVLAGCGSSGGATSGASTASGASGTQGGTSGTAAQTAGTTTPTTSAGTTSAPAAGKPGLKVNAKPKYGTPSSSAPVQSGTVQIAYRNIAINPDLVRVKV